MQEPERELIERAQAGDRSAFLDLVARHDRQIMSVVYRFSCDLFDREDLYQEVFLACFRSIKNFKSRSSFQTWLYRLALNRCITYTKDRQPTAEPREEAGEMIDWERWEKLKAVYRALEKLDGPQKLSFHLHYNEDWTVPQIAELLECRPGTVKSHLNRARVKIRGDREVLEWQTGT